MTQTIYGIDVSKKTLDVRDSRSFKAKFDNTPRGRQALAKRIKDTAALVVMEATGNHHKTLARELYEERIPVVVANPCRTSNFGRAIGAVNKNDTVDARTLALYGQSVDLPLYEPPAEHREKLQQISRLRQKLVKQRASVKMQLHEPCLEPEVARFLKESVSFFDRQVASVEKLLKSHIGSHPDLNEDVALVMSVPGFGWISAVAHVAELGDASRFKTSRQAASYAGICPAQVQSGTSKSTTHLSKAGRSRLRGSTYQAAMACIRKNGIYRGFYVRLLSAGKTKMSAVAAVMHKLCRVAFAVLKKRTRFDGLKAGLTTA